MEFHKHLLLLTLDNVKEGMFDKKWMPQNCVRLPYYYVSV